MSFLPALLERRRLVVATALLLTLTGAVAWTTMPREEDPNFPARDALLIVPFPGADAEIVERLVVEPVEEHLAEVVEVEDVWSTARAGVAIQRIKLNEHIQDPDDAWDEVREALAKAELEFPDGVGRMDLDDDLVSEEGIVLAVTGAADPLALAAAAEAAKRALLTIEEVKRVKLVADPGEQITIEYDDATARRLDVDPRRLGLELGQRSQIIPGGVIHLGSKTANLRPQTEFLSIGELAATPIVLPSGSAVPLGALARIRHGPEEPATERMRWNGQPAVGLGVVADDGIDTVAFGREVRRVLEELRPKLAPLSISEVAFQPDMVASRLDQLEGSLKLGILIVTGVLFLAIGLRLGLLVALVLPLVTFISISIFAAGGGILHQISIAALVIALGMLVDNAIVMVEAIQYRLDRGTPVRQAAVESVQELAMPLGTATGTTLAAFVPMLLSKGSTSDFTHDIPVLIMLTLSVSYLFAVTVTPVLAELFLRPRSTATESKSERLASWVAKVGVGRPLWVLAGAAVLITATVLTARFVDQQFFPAADRDLLLVDLRMPEGTHLEETDAVALEVERALESRPEVQWTATFVGRGTPRFYYNLQAKPNSPHRAVVVAKVGDLAAVERLMDWTREHVRQQIPEVVVVARRLEQGPPLEAPVELRLYGHQLEDLELAADLVLREARAVEGTRDVRHDLGLGVPTVRLEIDDAAAGRHGLSRADVALALLGRTLGLEIGQYRSGEDPAPILVRSSAGVGFQVADLATIDVATPGGAPVPLAEMARLAVEWRPAAIHHHQRSRLVKVQAQLAEGTTAHEVLSALAPRLAALELPAGVRLVTGGELEESSKANTALLRAMPFGVLLLLFFLLAEFNSFRRTAIVLVTVPLAATGVVPGLLLSGQPFGFMSMLGVISLVGIVVNNAIVLLDVIEQRRKAGRVLEVALAEAVRRRTRPILLTMATTVAGLMPLAFTRSTLWPPLAWAMISGLMASTVLTLLVVPALYRVLFRESRPGHAAPLGRRTGSRPAALGATLVLLTLGATAAKSEGTPLSLTLEEAMSRAAERPQAVAERLRADAASQGAEVERRTAWWPTVGLRADLTRRDRDFTFGTPLGELTLGERTSKAGALEVRQPLVDVPRAFYGVPAARSEATAAAARAVRVRRQLAAEAAARYVRVLELDSRIAATDAFIASLAARLGEIEARVEAGRTLAADALKVRLDLESAQLDRRRLVAARRVAAIELSRAVAHPGPVEPRFDGEVDRPAPLDAGALLDGALQQRADLQALERRATALGLRSQAVRAERWPRLEAVGRWQQTSGDPFRPAELLETALALSWSPFAAGTRRPRAAALDAERQALAAELDELRRAVAVEIEDALARLSTARATVEVRRRGVEYADETLRVEQERHRAGRATTNDLLDAEAALRRQRTEREVARLDVLLAWVAIDLATGRL